MNNFKGMGECLSGLLDKKVNPTTLSPLSAQQGPTRLPMERRGPCASLPCHPSVKAPKKIPLMPSAADSYEGKGKEVLLCFLSMSHLQFLKVRHSVIAKKTGCCVKTIERWVKRFHDDGIMLRRQENKYSPNEYTVLVSSKAVLGWRIRNESEEKREKILHDVNNKRYKKASSFKSGGVGHTCSSRRVYICNPYYECYAGASVVADCNENGVYPKKQEYKEKRTDSRVFAGNSCLRKGLNIRAEVFEDPAKPRSGERRRSLFYKGKAMLSAEMRKFLVENKDDSRIKEVFNSEKIQNALFPWASMSISKLLEMDDREKMKLIAFPDQAIIYAHGIIVSLVSGRAAPREPIRDRMGWLMSMLVKYCEKNKLKVDWDWYFSLCSMAGIEPIRHDEKPKELFTPAYQVLGTSEAKKKEDGNIPKRNEGGHSPMVVKPKKSILERYEAAKKEIKTCEEYIQKHKDDAKDPWCLMQLMQGSLQRAHEEIRELEGLHDPVLERHNQSLCFSKTVM